MHLAMIIRERVKCHKVALRSTTGGLCSDVPLPERQSCLTTFRGGPILAREGPLGGREQ